MPHYGTLLFFLLIILTTCYLYFTGKINDDDDDDDDDEAIFKCTGSLTFLQHEVLTKAAYATAIPSVIHFVSNYCRLCLSWAYVTAYCSKRFQ